MSEEKSLSEEKEMNQSTSSATDMRDWDLLDSDIVASKKDTMLNESEGEEKQSPSGLFIHESLGHSGVEELVADHDDLRHNESNTSSDIDIIDECFDTDDNHSNIPIMDISFCSSDISSTMSVSQVAPPSSAPVEAVESDISPVEETQSIPAAAPSNPGNSHFQYFLEILRVLIHGVVDYYRDGISVKELFIVGFVATICLALSCIQLTILKTSLHEAKMEQMEGHVNKLLTENEHLKSKVLAKIEDGKLFGELDEGVRDLKSENYKLHKAMQTVIHQLEDQTNAIKRGIDVKGDMLKDPYRKEITKLKEQINLLRIDNEELQKQLVRIRYGRHPSHAENRDSKESRSSSSSDNEQDKDQQQEIQELRRKLDDEVAKLKNWKDSIEDFVKEIEKPHKGEVFSKKNLEHRDEYHHEDKRKEKYDNEKRKERYEEEKSKEKLDEEKRKHKKKGRRFYNWSWKEIKSNFKGTLENFPDISDMISKYSLFDKKQVEGILDTICHYYKKAQDKTQKILESYSVDEKTQNVKNDIWTLMGEMKNKWVHMKNDFLLTHFGNPADEQNVEVSAEPEVTEPANQETKSKTDEQQLPPNVDSNVPEDSESVVYDSPVDELETILNEKDWEENMWNMKEVDELLKEAQRRFTQQESNINSWMFERAQHRAELRENDSPENDNADNNWYLRKNKDESDVFRSEDSSEEKYFKGN